MKEKLLSDWDELQKRPVVWGQTGEIVKKATEEIRILEDLKKGGDDIGPDGLPIIEAIQSRHEVLRAIDQASRG